MKRAGTGGVRTNDPPRDDLSRPLVARPVGSAGGRKELRGYDNPLAFTDGDPDSTNSFAPTVINVGPVPEPNATTRDARLGIVQKSYT